MLYQSPFEKEEEIAPMSYGRAADRQVSLANSDRNEVAENLKD
jgi:hypothetical protein